MEVEQKVQQIKDSIAEMPTAPSGDPVATIWKMVAAFQKDVQQLVDGRPESGKTGLIQIFRRSREQFRETIFYQAPCFKPFEKRREEKMARVHDGTVHDKTRMEDLEPPGPRDSSTFVYLDEVLDTAKKLVFAPHILLYSLTIPQCHHPRASA